MPTTVEYWTVDGTDLNTLAYNVESKASRLNVPPVRGENVLIPYRDGRAWQPKRPDERLITLSMWDSKDAIRAFAGDDIEAAVYYPEDDRYLIERGSRVRHYTVTAEVHPKEPDGR